MPSRCKTFRPSNAGQRPNSHQRGYTYKWEKAREQWLAQHPLCVMCEKEGIVELATVVDHIRPHRMDMTLFWAADTNWQSLCARCHSEKTGKGL